MKKLGKQKVKYRFFILISFFVLACTNSVEIKNSVFNPEIDKLAIGLYERGQNLNTFAGQGNINYIKNNQRHYFKFQIMAEKPNKLLFTVFDPAGRPAFKYICDGKKIYALYYSDKTLLTGEFTEENMLNFLPLALTNDEIWSLTIAYALQGLPKTVSAREKKTMGRVVTELSYSPISSVDNSLWRVQLQGALEEQKFETAIIEKVNFLVNRNNVLTIIYSNLKNIKREDTLNNENFPYKIEVEWKKSTKESLSINYDEVRLGLSLKNAFEFEVPSSFKVKYLN